MKPPHEKFLRTPLSTGSVANEKQTELQGF